MSDLVVKALTWAQMAGGQLPSLPQVACLTSDRPQPNLPGRFRDPHPIGITWRQPEHPVDLLHWGSSREAFSHHLGSLCPLLHCQFPAHLCQAGHWGVLLCSCHTVTLPKERERAWREGWVHSCRKRFSGIKDHYQILRKPMGAVSWDEIEWGRGEPCFNTGMDKKRLI